LYYVGTRRSHLTFGSEPAQVTAERVRQANVQFRHLRLEEEHRLALLNARWRLDLIETFCNSGRLLEVGCARGDFLSVAKGRFEVLGVEPNPDLAADADRVASVHHDVVETLADRDFDVAASFHVIEHVDSPLQFLAEIAARVKPGGCVVIETPNIRSLPFKTFRARWRQFIPEHYYFFDPLTISRLMESHGLRIRRIFHIGKYASVDLLLNRLSRYSGLLRNAEKWARAAGVSRWTFRVNPGDIMLVVATKK
jgi:2-polyprenyl-3-methyl-5-hydroxy-6-metoxy-1,4-benzoquinol methylase